MDIVFCSDFMLLFSEKERQECNISEACGCLWVYLADLRASEGGSRVHYNPFYDPLKHNGPLQPPAAALAPTLWPQFHLRWACPEEAQAGEIEAQCRKLVMKYTEMQKVVIFLHFVIITVTFETHGLPHFWMAITHCNISCYHALNFGGSLILFSVDLSFINYKNDSLFLSIVPNALNC